MARNIVGLESDGLSWTLNIKLATYTVSNVTIQATSSRDVTEVTVPNTIASYPVSAVSFRNNSTLKKVRYQRPAVTDNAFYQCTALEEVILEEGVTSIRDHAFYGCTSLKKVHLPDTLTDIRQIIFLNCSSLQSAIIPRAVTDIESYMFFGCTALRWLYIDGNYNANSYEFSDCNSLEWIRFSDLVTEMHSCGLRNCTAKTIIFAGELPTCTDTEETLTCFGSAETVYYPADSASWAKLAAEWDSEDCELKPYRTGFSVDERTTTRLQGTYVPETHPEDPALVVIAAYTADGKLAAVDCLQYDPDKVPVYSVEMRGIFHGKLQYKVFWLLQDSYLPRIAA